LKKGNTLMLAKKLFIALATAGLASLTASQGWALTATTSTVSSRGVASEDLIARYSKLAGSTANAQSLVTGLRNGTLVTLAPSATAPAGAPVISFTPATQKMGYGNIKIALSLAKTTLAKQGITNPTSEQLAAALNGGNVTLTNGTVVTLTGILTQRSAGMGWGKIAQTTNVKLGTVVSASQINKASKEDHKNVNSDDGASNGKGKSNSSSSSNSGGGSNSGGSNSGGNGGGKSGASGGGNSGGGGGSGGGGNSGGNSGGGGGKK
jgi:hypothetical protein